ncbi:MAG: hypothetical protein M1835_002845, partial [Candelina submexicana]
MEQRAAARYEARLGRIMKLIAEDAARHGGFGQEGVQEGGEWDKAGLRKLAHMQHLQQLKDRAQWAAL